MRFTRIVVAISGSGRSLKNLIEKQGAFSYQVVGVISSSPNCLGNTIAREYGIPLEIFDFRKQFLRQIVESIQTHLIEWRCDGVVLAGFLKHWPALDDWQGSVINIHPALLPKYGGPGMYGKHVHNAVISNQESHSGATVHLVDEVYDHGAIVSQVRVPVYPQDTPDQLAARVFEAECELLPRTIDKLAKSELVLDGQGVWRYDFHQQ